MINSDMLLQSCIKPNVHVSKTLSKCLHFVDVTSTHSLNWVDRRAKYFVICLRFENGFENGPLKQAFCFPFFFFFSLHMSFVDWSIALLMGIIIIIIFFYK